MRCEGEGRLDWREKVMEDWREKGREKGREDGLEEERVEWREKGRDWKLIKLQMERLECRQRECRFIFAT